MRYFNENMTYPEAQKKLFSVVGGKSKEEIEVIKNEYSKVLPAITKREMQENPFSMTEHPIKP